MNLLTLPIAAPQPMSASGVLKLNAAPRNVVAQANFLYGLAGTNVAAYLQTSIDGGATWIDIAQWTFAATSGRMVYNLNAQTPLVAAHIATDGTLAANTAVDGILGSMFRVKSVSTGTYTGGTTLAVDIETDQVA